MSDGFPNNPSDLDRASGNEKKYVYNSEDDTWKNFGGVADYPLVSDANDGLIYPDLYDRLIQIRESKDLNNLKLTEAKSYFYNFISTDKLVKFSVNKNNFIIELDKGAITRKLATMPCVGTRGLRGLQGKPGRDGVPASNEKYRPVFQDGAFEVDVQTPLEFQPISLRGYLFNTEEFEALLFLNGTVSDPDLGLTEVKLIGDPKSGKVTVKGILANPELRFKVRQRGINGENGGDGVNYVEAVIDDVESNGRFTEVVGMLRYNKHTNNLVFKKTSVNELLSNVTNIVASPNLPSKDYWAAVEITSNPRKAVEYHHFDTSIEAPPLDLPSYVPLSGCYNQKRYALGYLSAPENTPFTFVTDAFPEYQSCKDPYWFCGNSNGDGVCDGLINVDPTQLNVPFELSTSSSSESTESSLTSDSSDSESSDSEASPSSDSESSDSESSDSESSDSESSDSEDSPSSDSEDSPSSDSEDSPSSDSEDSPSSDSEDSPSSDSESSESLSSESASSQSSQSSESSAVPCASTATLSGSCSYGYGDYEVIDGIPTITFYFGFVLKYYGYWVVTEEPNYPYNYIYIYYESSYDLDCAGGPPSVTIEFVDFGYYYCTGTITVP